MSLIPSYKSTVIALLGLSCFSLHLVAQAQAADQNIVTKNASASPPAGGGASISDADLAKDLQNPLADLISVPLEGRLDSGSGNTERYTLNIQPVIPFELTPDWLMISRTILPVVADVSYEKSPIAGESGSGGGIGDITQSFFFAPKQPTDGWIIGAGPVLRLPTASREAFGAGRWGAGPTVVVLRQEEAWTYGMLANHIWSFAGWGPENVNVTYLQPFLAYTTDSLTTIGVGTESGYDWTDRQWTFPIDISVSQLVRIGNMPVEFGLGGRAYAVRPAGGPNWGLKLSVTFTFGK